MVRRKLDSPDRLEIRPHPHRIGNVLQIKRAGIGCGDRVEQAFGRIYRNAVGRQDAVGYIISIRGTESALQAHRHTFAQSVIIIELQRVGLHGHHLRTGSQPSRHLLDNIGGKKTHMSRRIGIAVIVNDHGRERLTVNVIEQSHSPVAQTQMQLFRQFCRDDHIAGHVFQFHRHIKILLVRLVHCLEKPEGGGKHKKE